MKRKYKWRIIISRGIISMLHVVKYGFITINKIKNILYRINSRKQREFTEYWRQYLVIYIVILMS